MVVLATFTATSTCRTSSADGPARPDDSANRSSAKEPKLLARDPMYLLLELCCRSSTTSQPPEDRSFWSIAAVLPDPEERIPWLILQGHYRLAQGVYDSGRSAMTGAGMRDIGPTRRRSRCLRQRWCLRRYPASQRRRRSGLRTRGALARRVLGAGRSDVPSRCRNKDSERAPLLRTLMQRSCVPKPVTTSAAAA